MFLFFGSGSLGIVGVVGRNGGGFFVVCVFVCYAGSFSLVL